MKLKISRGEAKGFNTIRACGYVECVRPKTAIRHLRKAVEASKKMNDVEKAIVLKWLENENDLAKTLSIVLEEVEVRLYEVLNGWCISVSTYVKEEVENANDGEGENITPSNEEEFTEEKVKNYHELNNCGEFEYDGYKCWFVNGTKELKTDHPQRQALRNWWFNIC